MNPEKKVSQDPNKISAQLIVEGCYFNSKLLIQIVEQRQTKEEIEVIVISEKEDGLCLLTSEFEEYMMSPEVSNMSVDDWLMNYKLPE
ncbi:MAG: hypothetical protein ACRCZO_17755 [Cetobacterium sp.]